MTGSFRGSCLCRTIRFEVDHFELQAGNCHCSMCRKFHGAAYATLAEVRSTNFRWLRGQDQLKSYTADNGTTRQFCADCGSSLTFANPTTAPDLIEIALACVDDAVPIRPNAHIFVSSGAAWASPDDDLPQYKAGRDSTRIR